VFIKVALKTFDEIKQPAARSIRQHTSASVSIHQHPSAYIGTRQHTSAFVSIHQHPSAYMSIRYVREHKSAHD
jgi:hypothetical protein